MKCKQCNGTEELITSGGKLYPGDSGMTPDGGGSIHECPCTQPIHPFQINYTYLCRPYPFKWKSGVYDGDTLHVEIDLGFLMVTTQRIRLLGVDTPELRGSEREEGLVVRDWVRDWITEAVARPISSKNKRWPLRIKTRKSDSFGRYLGTIQRVCDNAILNVELLKTGQASIYS